MIYTFQHPHECITMLTLLSPSEFEACNIPLDTFSKGPGGPSGDGGPGKPGGQGGPKGPRGPHGHGPKVIPKYTYVYHFKINLLTYIEIIV